MFKSTEPLSFDSPAGTDEVGRYLKSAKVFVSALAGNRTQDLPIYILFGEYLAAGSTPGAISLRNTAELKVRHKA